ncbi:unnamed protein product [Lactuca virosa]|uniref:Uncharacterized protein n=1 Tax=Lactuca virosa TaxID=75947 RepID=A0AAU9NH11_9ASTR|nr:unnamed protein product [Lactuca virosa]
MVLAHIILIVRVQLWNLTHLLVTPGKSGDLAYLSCEKRKFFETIGMEFGVPGFGKTGITASYMETKVTTLFLFKLILAVVHLGVLLRWFSPDMPTKGVDASIRSEVWPSLLGFYELNTCKEERDKLRTQGRKKYEKLHKQCRKLVGESSSNGESQSDSLTQGMESAKSEEVLLALSVLQAAQETGALKEAKDKLKKQLEELAWRLQLDKRLRVIYSIMLKYYDFCWKSFNVICPTCRLIWKKQKHKRH